MTEKAQEQATAPTNRADAPAWWQRITSLYNDSISHAFILHGNVRDYVLNGKPLPLEDYLVTRLAQHDLIIQLDPRGVRFPVPSHRDTLLRLLNLPGAPKSPLITAVRNGETSSPAAQSLRETTSLLDWLLTDPTLTVEAAGDARPVKVGVLFSMGDLLLPDADLSRTDGTILARLIHWAMDFRIGQRHVLMLIAESLTGIHSELRRASARWEAVAIPLPDAAHRERMIRFTCQRYDDLSLTDGLTERGVAQATGGLSLKQVEDVLFRGMGAGGLTREQISERKQTIIAQEFADVLQVGDARFDLGAVGGYDDLKAWLVQRVITPWHAGMLRIGGLLMSGPPGTGKTQLAEALAGSAGVPFVVFRLSKILGQFVGSSERNLERALQAILSLAPCLLFIDELDQAVRRGEADAAGSQVDNRVFARLLEFLEDPARRGRVLVAAATNRPDLLDAALRSRFDRTLPVLPPTAADRQAILVQQAKAAGIALPAEEVSPDETEGWTGRNIRDLVTMVAELVQDGTTPPAAVQEAMALYRPTLRDVAEMTALALREVSDLRLVPAEYRAAAGRERERVEPEPQAERRRAARL